MRLEDRARRHAALGDPARLLIVDELIASDRTVSELAEATGMRGNLLAHHLDVLDGAGLIRRRASEGDRRRRYVSIVGRSLDLQPPADSWQGPVVFVCTHNSARSQFAAAVWQQRTGSPARSAGSHPAGAVHSKAVRVAAELGVDLSGCRPQGYEAIDGVPDLVVSVCDRARETEIPVARRHVHWSVPDPVMRNTLSAFRSAFSEISDRVEGLGDLPGNAAP